MRSYITDGRLSPKQKSLGNRQRFVRRRKNEVREGVRKAISEGKIRDGSKGKGASASVKGTHEPSFGHDQNSGDKWYVAPGNKEFVRGDEIPVPESGGGKGGSQGSPDGEGEDDFTFSVTPEEFMEVFMEDLKLPRMRKTSADKSKLKVRVRAGFTKVGPDSALDLTHTMMSSLGRRWALKRPSKQLIEEMEERIQALREMEDLRSAEDDVELAVLNAALPLLRKKRARIPFIEPTTDAQYRHYSLQPKPIVQAVMFCLMDKSASMTEPLKDLAKRFFMLLHVFLTRYYREVHIVFIEHTSSAREVDEEAFFRGTETGGTVISTALAEMARIVKERYSPADWNIYAAQASDGDNFHGDMPRAIKLLDEDILPVTQYFAYIETVHGTNHDTSETPVWRDYKELRKKHKHLNIKLVGSPEDIFPVFHDLFSDDGA